MKKQNRKNKNWKNWTEIRKRKNYTGKSKPKSPTPKKTNNKQKNQTLKEYLPPQKIENMKPKT